MRARGRTQLANLAAEEVSNMQVEADDMNDSDGEMSIEEHQPQERGGQARTVFRAPRSDNDTQNSTRSLYDTDVVYIYLHGRRYCGDYFRPNDEEEQTRQLMLHGVYLNVLGDRHTTVPLANPQKILDVGCGTGEWAMSVGDLYPEAEVIGTDIAKIQPSAAPLNVYFEIDDAEEEDGWTFAEDEFDLVHFRSMQGSFADWDHIYKEAYKHLKPGGWIEVLDFDDHKEILSYFGDNADVQKWFSGLRESLNRSGKPYNADHLEPETLTSIGFVDVSSTGYDLPMGSWPDDPAAQKVAKHFLVAQLSGVESVSLRPLLELGWSIEEIRRTCKSVTEAMWKVGTDPEKAKGFGFKIKVLIGRKPGAPDIGAAGRHLSPGGRDDTDEGSIKTTNTVTNGNIT